MMLKRQEVSSSCLFEKMKDEMIELYLLTMVMDMIRIK